MSTRISQKEWEAALIERVTLPVFERLQQASVAIAGLGGLGSHIAIMLARAGLGALHLVDDDEVDLSNINRQAYSLCHLGEAKTDALCAILKDINPFMSLTTACTRVDESNAVAIFGAYSIVCEAFDDSANKAMLVNTLLSQCPHMNIVAASGMAGYGPANDIVSKQVMSRLTLCGDGCTDLMEGVPLVAPRVMLCAAHQAQAVIRLILNKTPL